MRSCIRAKAKGGLYFFTVNLAERRENNLLVLHVNLSYFSAHIPHQERISNSRKRKNERGVWQRRFWEHLIRDAEDYQRHFDYIHYNPVKHGYVQKAIDCLILHFIFGLSIKFIQQIGEIILIWIKCWVYAKLQLSLRATSYSANCFN